MRAVSSPDDTKSRHSKSASWAPTAAGACSGHLDQTRLLQRTAPRHQAWLSLHPVRRHCWLQRQPPETEGQRRSAQRTVGPLVKGVGDGLQAVLQAQQTQQAGAPWGGGRGHMRGTCGGRRRARQRGARRLQCGALRCCPPSSVAPCRLGRFLPPCPAGPAQGWRRRAGGGAALRRPAQRCGCPARQATSPFPLNDALLTAMEAMEERIEFTVTNAARLAVSAGGAATVQQGPHPGS